MIGVGLGVVAKRRYSGFPPPLRAFWQRVRDDGGTMQDYNSAISLYRSNNDALLAVSASATKAGKLYSVIPADGSGDFTVTAANGTRINKDGLIESVATNVPRINWVAGKPYVLREAQATNQIRNNSMQGASAGSPGILPTNWQNILAGLTRTIIGIGTEKGLDYIDIRLNGTANALAASIRPEAFAQIVSEPDQFWCISFWIKLIANPSPYVSSSIHLQENTAPGTFREDNNTAVTITNTLVRYNYCVQITNASANRVQPYVRFNLVNGQNYDFTVRIAMPQAERGTAVTSIIKTTTTTETRDADIISVALPAGTSKVTTNFRTGLPLVDNTPTTPYTMPVGEIESVIMED
jgi:hypothetical protein